MTETAAKRLLDTAEEHSQLVPAPSAGGLGKGALAWIRLHLGDLADHALPTADGL